MKAQTRQHDNVNLVQTVTVHTGQAPSGEAVFILELTSGQTLQKFALNDELAEVVCTTLGAGLQRLKTGPKN